MIIEKIVKGISNLTILTAFNANIDAIKVLRSEDIIKLISHIRIRKGEIKMLENIKSKKDFLTSLLYSMKNGIGFELPLENLELEKWFDEFIGYDQKMIGGQAGIVADLLSTLGLKVIFYTNPISKKFVKYFKKPENVFVPIVDQSFELVGIKEIVSENEIKVNRIFEFPRGLKVKINSLTFFTPRHSRFIVSKRPENIRICFDERLSSRIDKLCKDLEGAFISGFHGIKEKYKDGKTFEDYIQKNKKDLKKIKSKVPIHLELASMPNITARKSVVNNIFPVVNFVGMDDVELKQLAEIFDERIDEKNIENVIDFLIFLIERFKLDGIQLHTYYYMIFISQNLISRNELENALNFGNVLAICRAIFKDVKSIEEIKIAEKIPLNSVGKKICKKSEELIKKYKEYTIAVFPTRIVVNPRITVGLGDTLSSGIFVYLLHKLIGENR